MLVRTLIPLGWTLLGILALASLYMLVRAATERTSSPEAGRGLGVYAVLLVMAIVALMGWLFSIAARKQSTAGLITMTLLLAYPLALLVARPIVLGYKTWKWEREQGRVGEFQEAALRPMARAIRANDTLALKQLLEGKAPPNGTDEAGNDLLAYALVLLRSQRGSPDPVRVLLDAGADPRATRIGDGEDVVNYLVKGSSAAERDVLRLLLQRGADPNTPDPWSGQTPVRNVYDDLDNLRILVENGAEVDRLQPDGLPALVHFIGAQQWELALYLIDKGANLDLKNADGLSVDHYLKEWKDGVYGAPSAGWDSVRTAISKRRAGSASR